MIFFRLYGNQGKTKSEIFGILLRYVEIAEYAKQFSRKHISCNK